MALLFPNVFFSPSDPSGTSGLYIWGLVGSVAALHRSPESVLSRGCGGYSHQRRQRWTLIARRESISEGFGKSTPLSHSHFRPLRFPAVQVTVTGSALCEYRLVVALDEQCHPGWSLEHYGAAHRPGCQDAAAVSRLLPTVHCGWTPTN